MEDGAGNGSGAEQVLPDAGDDRTGTNPAVGGLVRVVIVESAAGGVGAVERIPCSATGRVGDRFVDLTIGDGGEGSGLVDDAGDAVGEGGGFHPIEDNGADSDLTDIRFSAGFGGDDAGKQFQIGIGNRCAGGRRGNANQFEGFPVGNTGSGQTVFLLEAFDRFGGLGAVIAGDFAGEVTPGFEAGLYFGDLLSAGAILGQDIDSRL